MAKTGIFSNVSYGKSSSLVSTSVDSKEKNSKSRNIVVATGLNPGVVVTKANDGQYVFKRVDVLNDGKRDVAVDDRILGNILKLESEKGASAISQLVNNAKTVQVDDSSYSSIKSILAMQIKELMSAKEKGVQASRIKLLGLASPEMKSIRDPELKKKFNSIIAMARAEGLKSMLDDLVRTGRVEILGENGQTRVITLGDVLSEAGIVDYGQKLKARTEIAKMLEDIGTSYNVLPMKDNENMSAGRGWALVIESEQQSPDTSEKKEDDTIAKFAYLLVKPSLTQREKVNWNLPGFQRGRFGYEAYMTNLYGMVASELPKAVHNANAEVSDAVQTNPIMKLNEAMTLYKIIKESPELASFVKSATSQQMSELDQAKIRAMYARTLKDLASIELMRKKMQEQSNNARKSMNDDEFKKYRDVVNQYVKQIQSQYMSAGLKMVENNGILELAGFDTIPPHKAKELASKMRSNLDNLDSWLNMVKMSDKVRNNARDYLRSLLELAISSLESRASEETSKVNKTGS